MNVTFTPINPDLGGAVLGSFDEATLVDGCWVAGRRSDGEETDHKRCWQGMRTFGDYRSTVFQRK